MALDTGVRLGPYEIVALIGSGSMGDVYRAHDTRLNRDVAIKVLPPAVAADANRIARFEREARAVAAINHPNILALYDVGSAEMSDADQRVVRVTYLVTELLDGDTLRARLVHGPLSARKSADVAMQVARGMAAAHDRGIVHRDLKPENIVLLRDGHVKILDFGLAKPPADSKPADEQQTFAATDAGMIMGTVGYMAPEQVRGEPADPRTDVFAVGAVLYELVSGRRPFQRPTAAETMTAILREEPPDLTSVRADISPALDRIVRHCLEKDPDDRFQSGRDLAFALQELADSQGSGAARAVAAGAPARTVRRRDRARWLLLGGAIGFACVGLLWWRTIPPTPVAASQVLFTFSSPWNDAVLGSPSVSPDGTRIAFIAQRRAGDSIVVRRLDAMQAQPLGGTAGARMGSLCWSPDGRALGFFAGGKLKTIELATGKVEILADAPSGYGAAWGQDGTILFSPDERTPIFRVSANGGESAPVTKLDPAKHEEAHRFPQFLPDGRHFVFMTWNASTTTRNIQISAIDGTPVTKLFESSSAAVVAGNYLIYVRDLPSHLLAQAFDPKTLRLEGRPVVVVSDDNVDYNWRSGDPAAAASLGTLVYTTGKFRTNQLKWFSRAGRPLGTLGDPDVYFDPAIAPDGTALAIEKRDADRGSTDLWTVDLARGAFSRLTSAPGFESVATWSPDGRRIAFASDDKPGPKISVKNASGTGAEEVLVDGRSFVTDWSRDGRYLLFMTDGGATRLDVWVYDVERRTSKPLLASPFTEGLAKFSPDGKWIAYVSDEGQERQVYVRSFPDGTKKVQASPGGGNEPEWRRDGKELFYLAPDDTLMAADVRFNGAEIAVGAPQPLFQTNVQQDRVTRNTYAASVDGQRFLVLSPVVDPNASPLVAVLNWTAGLARR